MCLLLVFSLQVWVSSVRVLLLEPFARSFFFYYNNNKNYSADCRVLCLPAVKRA